MAWRRGKERTLKESKKSEVLDKLKAHIIFILDHKSKAKSEGLQVPSNTNSF